MLDRVTNAPAETPPADLVAQYLDALADVIDTVGPAVVAERTSVSEATLRAVQHGEPPELDLDDTASILSLSPDAPDPETIASEARSHLLLQMTNAVVNIDVLAADLGLDLDPKELQAKLEGRLPLSLREYAEITHHLAARIAR